MFQWSCSNHGRAGDGDQRERARGMLQSMPVDANHTIARQQLPFLGGGAPWRQLENRVALADDHAEAVGPMAPSWRFKC